MRSLNHHRPALDAVAFLAGLGGTEAVSYRTVAQLAGAAPSTIQDWFPSRTDLLRESATHLAGVRHQALRSRVALAGIEGMVPETQEELFESGSWLAFRAAARIEPSVAVEVEKGRKRERRLMGQVLASRVPTSLHLLVEGLEQTCCDAAAPMTHAQAVRILRAATHHVVVPRAEANRAA